MHIFHIPSWFPCRHGLYTGISCENLIRCVSDDYPDTNHTVSLIQESTYIWLFHHPSVIKELFGYFHANKEIKCVKKSPNLDYFFSSKGILYSTRLGFKWRPYGYKKHKKNLQLCIEKKGKPDLIHAQVTNNGGYAAWLLSKEFDIPYIITERFAPFPMPEYLKNDRLIDDIYKPLNEANEVISVSPAFAKIIQKYCDRKVVAIPNFLDEKFFKPAENLKNISKNRLFQFSTLTLTYDPRKGIDTLITAIKIIKDKGFNALFKIGGGREDKYYKKVRQLTKYLGVEDHVEWFGKIDRNEVLDLMQKSDCFVLPSTSESFGTVYIEAMACGKPVIASLSGGPESIVNDKTGILVSVDNPEELANALIHMIKNHSSYSPVAIRQEFLDKFSKRAITKKYINLYQSIIK